MANIAVYDATEEDRLALAGLQDSNEVTFFDESLSESNLVKQAEVISVFVSSSVDKSLLAAMPNLKLIATRSTGYNHIDREAAKSAGVTIAAVPTYGEHTVAEYTFTLLLALTRKLFDAAEQVDQGELNANTVHGTDLFGKTIGVIGLGKIGRNVATIAKAFGMKVLAFDVHVDEKTAKEIGLEYKTLDELAKQSDVISLHVPVTSANQHMIDKDFLGKMKRGAYLINTARGELVDTMALVDALQSGQLAGAAIDVVEDERLMDLDEEELILRKGRIPRASLEHMVAIDILQKMFNVIITGHNAYNTVEAIERINSTTLENIEKFLDGKPQNEVK